MTADPAEYIRTSETKPRITRWHRTLSWITSVNLTGSSEGVGWFGVHTFRDTYTIRNGRIRSIDREETSFIKYRDLKDSE